MATDSNCYFVSDSPVRNASGQAAAAGERPRLRSRLNHLLPLAWRRRLRSVLRSPGVPRVGHVNLGHLRRTSPLCGLYGYSRGEPVDRYYIESFLAAHAGDVRGRVLEVGDHTYTFRFGGERVMQSDVLHVAKAHDRVTIVGNLETGENLPSDTFDCFICTQTLNLIYDLEASMHHARRCLKPGGVLLLTAGAITPFSREEQERWNAYWRLTSPALRQLAAHAFGPEADVEVAGYGNVLSATAFLYGMAQSELTKAELEARDGGYEVVVSLRAVK